jgi:hypothetical protein
MDDLEQFLSGGTAAAPATARPKAASGPVTPQKALGQADLAGEIERLQANLRDAVPGSPLHTRTQQYLAEAQKELGGAAPAARSMAPAMAPAPAAPSGDSLEAFLSGAPAPSAQAPAPAPAAAPVAAAPAAPKSKIGTLTESTLGSLAGGLETVSAVGGGLLAQIPAGLRGLYELATTQDPAKAAKAVEETHKFLTEKLQPSTPEGQKYLKATADVMGKLNIPAEAIGQYTLEKTGSPALATASEILLNPLNAVGAIGPAAKALGAGAKAAAKAAKTGGAVAQDFSATAEALRTQFQNKIEATSDAIRAQRAGGVAAAPAVPGAVVPAATPAMAAVPAAQPGGRQSVGAAAVDAETGRVAQAQQLYDPIALSKDQATRNPADVRFARETAKDPVFGQALQEKYASDNAKLINNLDIHINKTGAELTGVGAGELGKALTDVVTPYQAGIKGAIAPAYDAARAAGQMADPVDVAVFRNYLKDHQAEAINAPVLKSVEAKLKTLTEGKTTISVNDLEEIRKMTGTLAQDSAPNAYYGRQVIKMIDKATEGKGGPLYQQARKLNENYMREFENTPVIKNILAMKPGKTQRAVAIEDLVEKSMLKGPRSDVEQLFASLNKAGPQGQQMVNELRGFVAQKIRDEATKSVTKDINGLPYVSSHKLNSIVTDLDRSGKLDYIFGKELADKYRTINDVAKDVLTVPQGTTNPSGTASTMIAAMTEMGVQAATTGIPVPLVMIGKQLYGKRQAAKKNTKINEFINYTKPQKAPPLGGPTP